MPTGLEILSGFLIMVSIISLIVYIIYRTCSMQTIEQTIISVAIKNNGNFTLPLISYKTGLQISWCQIIINQLIKKGVVDVSAQNNGSIQYTIKEFASEEPEEIIEKQLTQ